MDHLRFITAGNVDDGKSTLIGRLMYDSKAILEDQLAAIERASREDGELNLALLTDGLKAEREQGITIDVAYRYFSTPKRKFIIGDSPGHAQYTRNMITAASTANLMILLVDSRAGLTEQSRRHLFIASLLRIPHLVICVNKMDLVGFSEERFEEIRGEYNEFSAKLEIHDVHFIPISALHGDNVVDRSSRISWYQGTTLMHTLENVHVASDRNVIDLRASVQSVVRNGEYRGYGTTVASGTLREGDEVMLLPSGLTTTIRSLDYVGPKRTEISAPHAATVRLDGEFDLSRGGMLVRPNNIPKVGQDLDLDLCWMDSTPLDPTGMYSLIHLHSEVRCVLKKIHYRFDVNTLSRDTQDLMVRMNDIAKVSVRVTQPIFYDEFRRNRATGAVILIDEKTNQTCAAGMIL